MNDPFAKPAKATVTHFGVEVPVFEHMLVGEYDELEVLLANPNITGFHKDVESFAICARYRSDARITFDSVKNQPMNREKFSEDVRLLLDPFVRAQRALVRARRMERLAEITPEAIEREMEALAALKRAVGAMSARGDSLPS
jgi:hypothetical protein